MRASRRRLRGVDVAGPAPARGLVALGASAVGIEALQRVMRELPEDLASAVCRVLHIPATARSLLAEIVSRHTPLRVSEAIDISRRVPGGSPSALTCPECHGGAAERAELVRGVLIVDEEPLEPIREGAE
jgi:chemotaxis response regulator CheB